MTDPTSTPNSSPLEHQVPFREAGETDLLTDEEMMRVGQRLGDLALSQDTVLAPHQQEAFEDITNFFQRGGRECYVKLPTGTGKTVLFVEVVREQIESARREGEKSRAIVLVPTVDLVTQTVGSIDSETGKKRGFTGFAPELDARPLHGSVRPKEKAANIAEADVLVTTYNTFRTMVSSFVEAESKTESAWLAEMQGYIENERHQRILLSQHKAQRKAFLDEAYTRQEVRIARARAKVQLAEHKREGNLDKKTVGNLQEIVRIADSEDDDKTKLTQLKKAARKMVSPAAERRIAQLKELGASKRKQRDSKGQSDNPTAEVADQEKEQQEVPKLKMSRFDGFIASFVYRHRSGRRPKADELTLHKDRLKLHEYTESIKYARWEIHHMNTRAERISNLLQIKDAVGQFDVMICDEAHRSVGSVTWDAVREYARRKDIAIIGTTATDEYYDRSLEDYFEERAHELTKQEAIRSEIVNPVALFAHETGLRFSGVDLDASGDYDRTSIREMRLSEERNRIGVDYVKLLAEAGYQGIMPAIAGDEGEHAIELARMLNAEEIIDSKTGESRNLRAEAVLGTTDPALRKLYFEEFERGEIDWITFVDVIREGWDSDAAKAIVNMRPTRSPLLATQRLGRIGRTSPEAPVSIVVDLFDGIESREEFLEIPPVLAADVFEVDEVKQGHVIGRTPESSRGLINKLRGEMPNEQITAYHSQYVDLLDNIMVVDGGGVGRGFGANRASRNWQTYESVRRMFRGYLPKEILLEATEGNEPQVRASRGRSGQRVLPLFNVEDVRTLHQDKPEVNLWKLYVDENDQRWITPEGCTKLLSKRFPHLSPEEVVDMIRYVEEIDGTLFEKAIGRIRLDFGPETIRRPMGLTHMYKLDEVMERLVPTLS